MENQSPLRVLGAVFVLAIAILCAAVIAMGFLAPERMFSGGITPIVFLAAVPLMLVCAVVANLYDVRGILLDAFN